MLLVVLETDIFQGKAAFAGVQDFKSGARAAKGSFWFDLAIEGFWKRF